MLTQPVKGLKQRSSSGIGLENTLVTVAQRSVVSSDSQLSEICRPDAKLVPKIKLDNLPSHSDLYVRLYTGKVLLQKLQFLYLPACLLRCSALSGSQYLQYTRFLALTRTSNMTEIAPSRAPNFCTTNHWCFQQALLF